MASLGQQSLPPASPPTAPPGWQVTWSDPHNQWYYVDIATGLSQWEYPSGPTHATQSNATPQSTHQYPDQHQYPQQEHAATQGGTSPEASRGLVSTAAGAILGYEIKQHSHHNNNNNFLDSMATFVGGAGIGALGAKLFGGSKPQPAQNVPPTSHQPSFQGYAASQPPPAPYYPAQPVHTGQPMPSGSGHYAMGAGAAAGVASMIGVNAVSNYAHHYQQPVASPPIMGASSGMGNISGGLFNAGPHLTIHAAAFADKDVTESVRMLVNSDQQISLQKKLTEEFADPWPEAERKGLSILYQYGDRPMEVWAGSTEETVLIIKNEALSNERMSFVTKRPGRILCLIWGQQSVLSDARLEKLEKEGELDCKDLGNGGWWAWNQRTLICYYRGSQGNVEIAHAREGGTLRLPWNPLAKWS